MSFPSILDLKLGTYPNWVQTVMFATALLWLVTWMVLVFRAPLPPPAKVEWIELTRVIDPAFPGALSFTATFVNNTGKSVILQHMFLAYVEDERPTSGLQSENTVDTRYRVERIGDSTVATPTNSPPRVVEVRQVQPFDGQSYTEAVVPLDEFIRDADKARVQVTLLDDSLLDPGTNLLQIRATFSNGHTEERSLALEP